MQITSKLPEVGTTIFTIMSKLAVDYKAINLGQGFPDFNADQRLLNLVTQAMHRFKAARDPNKVLRTLMGSDIGQLVRGIPGRAPN